MKSGRAGLASGPQASCPPWDAPEVLLCRCDLPAAVERQSEHDQFAKIECRSASMRPGLVALDPAIAKSSVVLRDEPGDRSLGHRAVFAICLAQFVVAPRNSCLNKLLVVFGDGEGAGDGLRAVGPQWTSRTVRGELGDATFGETDHVSRRTGDIACFVVDDEVVTDEPAEHDRS